MRQFEFPYNFDKNLIQILHTLDPEGKTINCIYLPPFIKDYDTILRSEEQTLFLNNMTRNEYENHIHFISEIYPNKIQILLQKENLLMSEKLINYYINLGIKNFCVASLDQAKLIKLIDPTINVVGSIAMQITLDELNKNKQNYKLYFNSFVLPFSASRKLDTLKLYPKDFNYILLVNAYCNIKCNGKNHWNLKYNDKDSEMTCPGLLGDIPWDLSARIRPMDLGFFDPYISIYKLQDRGWPTAEIIRDYILYTTDYSLIPLEYNSQMYNSETMIQKTNCYMTFADENYLPCIVRQAQRIKYLQCKYPFIVLIDDNDKKSQQILEENNITYVKIEQDKFILNEGVKGQAIRFQKTINKFKLLDFLSEYEKICWLDADTILLKNIDYLFDEMSPNSQFLGFINQKRCQIDGEIFILTNKIDIKNFKNNLDKNRDQMLTDEEVLNNYFQNIPQINLCFIEITGQMFIHFSGYLKLYNYIDAFPLMRKIFYSYSENEFNKFINEKGTKLNNLSYYWGIFTDKISTITENYLEYKDNDSKN